jgi:hypothetical protein
MISPTANAGGSACTRKAASAHEMPAHHELEAFLDEYIKAAGLGEDGKSPLFRSALGRTGLLNGEDMHRVDAYRMIQRHASELGMKVKMNVTKVTRTYDDGVDSCPFTFAVPHDETFRALQGRLVPLLALRCL